MSNKRNKEHQKEYNRTYYLKNRFTANDAPRKHFLKKRYGISIERYQELQSAQNNICAVCLRQETAKQNGRLRALSVDHDHRTGNVRGLLCGHCNRALGLLREDPTIIKAMLAYVLSHNETVNNQCVL